jgi:hypothetical protein
MKKVLSLLITVFLISSFGTNVSQAACSSLKSGYINCDNGVKGFKTDLGGGISRQNFNDGVKSQTTTKGDGSKITRFNDGRTLIEQKGFKPKWVR